MTDQTIDIATWQCETIANICHDANRVLQGWQSYNGIPIAPPWNECTEEMRVSVRSGVMGIINGNTPEQSHEGWLKFKREHGWTYGPVKDEEAKTHPCMVPYGQLPAGQRFKDSLFSAIVKVCAEAIAANPCWPDDNIAQEIATKEGDDMGNEYTDQQAPAEDQPTQPADDGLTNNEVLDDEEDEDWNDYEEDDD